MNTNPAENIPVTTITGFLGAGKTTLVNQLIKNANGSRIVVLVNDFGDINIDSELIENVEDDRVSLKNGCVCCSLNEDLILSISQFVRQSQPPDVIVIEASGVADPATLIRSIDTLEQADLVKSDCRICVIDAEHFNTLGYELTEQIIDGAATSDLVLLNKVDLASSENRELLKSTLTVSAPNATLIETSHCEVPFYGIFYGNSISRPQGEQLATSDKVSSQHTDGYASWSRQISHPLDREQFFEFSRLLMQLAFRAKAIVYFQEKPDIAFVFNLVGTRVTIEPLQANVTKHSSSIVAIGITKEFDEVEIDRQFELLIHSH